MYAAGIRCEVEFDAEPERLTCRWIAAWRSPMPQNPYTEADGLVGRWDAPGGRAVCVPAEA